MAARRPPRDETTGTKRGAAASARHVWTFTKRFRKGGFGWRSQPAMQRVKDAIAEIRKVAKTDRVLAAEGAVLFVERVSGALENVDSSSGSIGNAVNAAIDELAEVIAAADVDAAARDGWLRRLWDAQQADEIPYIEALADQWGKLCVEKSTASAWADELMGLTRMAWSPDPNLRGYFKGTVNCLSALLAAGRHDELLQLVETAPYKMWHYRQYGVKALVAQGKKAEAIRYAESGIGLNDPVGAIAEACEGILLSSGLIDEAYRRYGLSATYATTYLARFRAILKKYPTKAPADVLADLVASMPGDEGKWFAAAKDAGLLDEAIALARRSPCDPKTLTRASRDHLEAAPEFAHQAGYQALHWLAQGHGYDITGADVWAAYGATMAAAKRLGVEPETRSRVRALVSAETMPDRFLSKVLGQELSR